jgi:CRISPR-associated protein Csb3
MTDRPSAFDVPVNLTNPGQFFACCGLLELADRRWHGAEGWFESSRFYLRAVTDQTPEPSIGILIDAAAGSTLHQLDPTDDYGSPIEIEAPFGLRLDWWRDKRSGGDRLKVWAGSMRGIRIARAMQRALVRVELQTAALLDYATVVADPAEPDNKVEPYYFDSRRGSNAKSIDIGFSPDSLQMKTVAYPAVEFLTLVGLQRHRPMPTDVPRVFTYHPWATPLPVSITPAAVCGLFSDPDGATFRFENGFRTDQRKHKGFMPATRIARTPQ